MVLNFRLRAPSGVHNVRGVDNKTSLRDFYSLICSLTGLPANEQKITFGFPQKQLSGSLESPISSLLQDGETLSVIQCPPLFPLQPDISPQSSSPSESEQHDVPLPSKLLIKPTVRKASTSDSERAVAIRRKVDDDNSCLFRAAALCLLQDRAKGDLLRQRCADVIAAQPFKYNDAVLGKPNAEYVKWILNTRSWGGAIELDVLSTITQTQILCFDTQSLRIDRFGEEKGYDTSICLIYDGLHYDSLNLAPSSSSPESSDFSLISSQDDLALAKFFMLCEQEHSSGKFTDLAKFTLRCGVCGEGLQGESGAAKHAMSTGHSEFTEYRR